MIGWLLGKIGIKVATDTVASITTKIADAYKAKLQARNDQARLEADLTIKELESQREVLLAEQGKWYTAWIRPALAAPFVVFTWKVVVWDTVLGLGSTPHLSAEMYWVLTVVVGAYFLTRPFEKWARK